ncbi:MAG: GNAT family N-acetyltransferase [Candidatus Thorarchaeota archaeon]
MNEWVFDAKNGGRISIRHAKVTDASDLYAGFSQVVAEGEWLPANSANSNRNEWAEWIQRTYGNREVLLVAHVDGEYAGHLSLQPEEWMASRHVAKLGVIVTKPYRGLGVGRSLMIAAEDAARQQRYEKIILSTFDNNFIAKSLYDSLGYRLIGKRMRHFLMPKGYIDEVLMEKTIVYG